MQIPHYEPFYLSSLAALRAEIERLALDIPLSNELSVLSTPLAGISNRFCAQPISGQDALTDGSPGPLTHHRYHRLAAGGFGLIWIESTAIAPTAAPGKLRLHDDTVDAFLKLVKGIRAAAPLPVTLILQLEIPDASAIPSDAAGLVSQAGFDGIDIQAGHTSFEDRRRFLTESIKRIRADNPKLLTAVRLCAYDSTFGTDPNDYRREDLREPQMLAAALHSAGLDFLNVTSASPRLRGPSADRKTHPVSDHGVPDEHPLQVLSRQLRVARSLRDAAPGLPIIGSGFSWLRQFLPEVAAAAVAGDTMDLVGLGRSALACPDAPLQIMNQGRLEPGTTCMDCFGCDAMRESGGPVGCPVRDPKPYGVPPLPPRQVEPGQLASEALRCHLCEAAPCVTASRTGMDIPAMINAFRRGDESQAYEIIRRHDVMPEMTARLTPGWLHSEGACIETALTGTPVPILDLQYEIAWQARRRGETDVRLPASHGGKSVAVVGAGPAGLAATIRLLEYGHRVDLYERSNSLGGTPEHVIPAQRFPSAQPEIDAILAPAIAARRLHIHHGRSLGRNLDLDELCDHSDAVLLATGVWQERKLVDGDYGLGVIDALSFLESVKNGTRTHVSERVLILAGGDCAMDAARCAERLGGKDIYIVYGGPRSEMHWHMPEDWFAQTGHHAMMECQPLGYACDTDGRHPRLRIREKGKERLFDADLVIEAMGLQIDDGLRPALAGVSFNDHGLISLGNGSQTTRSGVYAAGGIVNGGASVARCIAEGLAAAEQIHTRFK